MKIHGKTCKTITENCTIVKQICTNGKGTPAYCLNESKTFTSLSNCRFAYFLVLEIES